MLLEDLAYWDSIDDIDIDKSFVDTVDFKLPVSFTGMKDGEIVTMDAEIPFICDCALEDVGIGAYEFWGFVGCDSRMEWEIATLELDGDVPESLEWVKEALIDKVKEAIQDLPTRQRIEYD